MLGRSFCLFSKASLCPKNKKSVEANKLNNNSLPHSFWVPRAKASPCLEPCKSEVICQHRWITLILETCVSAWKSLNSFNFMYFAYLVPRYLNCETWYLLNWNTRIIFNLWIQSLSEIVVIEHSMILLHFCYRIAAKKLLIFSLC